MYESNNDFIKKIVYHKKPSKTPEGIGLPENVTSFSNSLRTLNIKTPLKISSSQRNCC